MTKRIEVVAFDPELAEALKRVPLPSTLTFEMVLAARTQFDTVPPAIAELARVKGIEWQDLEIPGADGDPMKATVFRPRGAQAQAAGILHTHGGGMVLGDRFLGADSFLDWIAETHCVLLTIDYRLAPEHPHPAPSEDCYAALLWMETHADELKIDPKRIAVAGASAGGGLAAAVALMARDRDGPKLIAQILGCPMLDDRNETASAFQIDGVGIWDRTSNLMGWRSLLGERCGTAGVSSYAAPARAENLAGLPPAFIDVGSAEVFRDEAVAYATRLWAAGGLAELHVWPGAFHGFDSLAPESALAKIARSTRAAWIKRALC
ncbi:MAG: alpha/beta hydrolase [Spongiibacteraceae bacterium]